MTLEEWKSERLRIEARTRQLIRQRRVDWWITMVVAGIGGVVAVGIFIHEIAWGNHW